MIVFAMPRSGHAVWNVLGLSLTAWILPVTVHGQVSPVESARRLKPAPGLEATLWASEPMLVNPTNIDIDSRGRVWVTEGLNYRLTRGGRSGGQATLATTIVSAQPVSFTGGEASLSARR